MPSTERLPAATPDAWSLCFLAFVVCGPVPAAAGRSAKECNA